MAAAPYRRVAQGDDVPVTSRSRTERFFDKVYAFVWVAIAIVVAKFTRFFPILLNDERIVKPLLYASVVLMGVSTVLVLYLVLYLPRVKGITDSSAWDVYCPRVVPTLTVNGILIAIMLIRSIWPVWGFLSPLILGVESFGCLFALHFVPWL